MVLNHIYSRKNAQGGIEYFWPEEVENVYDARGAITGAKLKSDGSDITYGGVGTMSVEEQRRRPAIADRYAGRRHRAPVRHVRQPARADAGMVGFGRGRLEPLPAPPVVHQLRAARSRGARWPRAPTGRRAGPGQGPASRGLRPAQASRLRLSAHSVQHRGVGLHEDAERHRRRQAAGRPARRRRLAPRRWASLLRVLYPVVPHVTWHLWQDLGYAKELGDLLDAPGRTWTKPR